MGRTKEKTWADAKSLIGRLYYTESYSLPFTINIM